MGASTSWIQRPSYALLFADLDPESAGDVVSRLKAAKVDVPAGRGRPIRPRPRVEDRRAASGFASGGLPSSGRIGFEIFDRTAFGATEFLEQVNYRRALEGEIAPDDRDARRGLERARAHRHVADSLFASKEQPAKASVVLKLRGNRPPANATVQGHRESRRLQRRGSPAGSGRHPRQLRPAARAAGRRRTTSRRAAQMERQQRIEHDLTTKVVSLLEPVVGSEGVRVNVSVRLDPQSEEATEEKWDPTTQAIRSRQVDGRRGCAPVRPARRAWPVPVRICRRLFRRRPPARLRNRLQRLRRRRRRLLLSRAVPRRPTTRSADHPPHDSSREAKWRALSVAVILDNEAVVAKNPDGTTSRSTHARKPEELQKIQSIVAAAVGLDASRGDQLTIENVAVRRTPVEEPARSPSGSAWRRRPGKAAAFWLSWFSACSRSSCS